MWQGGTQHCCVWLLCAAGMLWSSTAATRWTTRAWARSTRAWRRAACGAASTSSTASTWTCCQSAPSRYTCCPVPAALAATSVCACVCVCAYGTGTTLPAGTAGVTVALTGWHPCVACTQIYCILSAIRERKKSFVFTDGSSVSLDSRVGFFITMVRGGTAALCLVHHAAHPALGVDIWNVAHM